MVWNKRDCRETRFRKRFIPTIVTSIVYGNRFVLGHFRMN